MVVVTHIGTLQSDVPGLADNIVDLVFRPGDDMPILAAVNGGYGEDGSRISFFRPGGTGGPMQLTDSVLMPAPRIPGFQPTGHWLAGGGTFITPGLFDGLAEGWHVGPDGRIIDRVPAATAGLPPDATAIHQLDIGGATFHAVAQPGVAGFTLYRSRPDGSHVQTATAAPPPASGPMATIADFTSFTMGGQTWLAGASPAGNYVGLYRVTTQGRLETGLFIDIPTGAWFAAPHNLVSVEVDGLRYVIVGGGNSSSLTSLQLTSNNRLITADHVIDELTTRMANVTVLKSIAIAGRSFVIAGGRDDGVTVFTVLPDGSLLLTATITDDDSMALANVSAMDVTEIGGLVMLAVASATENGITQLSLDPGPIGLTRYVQAGVQNGTAANDLLMATAQTTVLNGGAGDDILVSGPGDLIMTGGPGRDLFVISEGVGTVTITDFDPAEDRLDLSRMGARSTWDLDVQTSAGGLIVRFRNLTVVIKGADGQSLDPGLITNDLFPIAHYRPMPARTTIIGTNGDDFLVGGPGPSLIEGRGGNDTLMGGFYNDTLRAGIGDNIMYGDGGHDLIYGGPGNDTIFGGDGNDTMYGGPGNDEMWGGPGNDYMQGNAGDDVMHGEEGNDTMVGGPGNDTMYGGPGDDLLFGSGGDDLIFGDDGNDTLRGNRGNDTLYGGPGDDLLVGGADDDLLYGGPGDDRLFGSPGNDTLYGGAGNDTLRGGIGDDVLYGEAGDDWLYGGPGNDLLVGGPGDDWMHGGIGNDTLYGGPGSDTMTGGAGADVFVFKAFSDSRPGAHDIITDFAPGIDRLDMRAMNLHLVDGGSFTRRPGELIIERDGRSTWLHADETGNGVADFSLLLERGPNITHLDLLL